MREERGADPRPACSAGRRGGPLHAVLVTHPPRLLHARSLGRVVGHARRAGEFRFYPTSSPNSSRSPSQPSGWCGPSAAFYGPGPRDRDRFGPLSIPLEPAESFATAYEPVISARAPDRVENASASVGSKGSEPRFAGCSRGVAGRASRLLAARSGARWRCCHAWRATGCAVIDIGAATGALLTSRPTRGTLLPGKLAAQASGFACLIVEAMYEERRCDKASGCDDSPRVRIAGSADVDLSRDRAETSQVGCRGVTGRARRRGVASHAWLRAFTPSLRGLWDGYARVGVRPRPMGPAKPGPEGEGERRHARARRLGGGPIGRGRSSRGLRTLRTRREQPGVASGCWPAGGLRRR